MRERLIEQHHFGPTHERAGEGDSLTLAGRELVGETVGKST